MSFFEIALLLGLLLLFFIFFIFIKKNIQPNQTNKLEIQLQQEKKELEGKLSEIINQKNQLNFDLKAKDILLDAKNKRIYDLEARLKEKEKQVRDEIEKLNYSGKQFQGEQARVRKEDEMKQEQEKENQSRIWNDHEIKSLNFMKDICKKEDIQLSCYSNTKPPPDFPTNLKPDFTVKIMDQYAIFDAKFSKSSNISTYLKTQVKQSAIKYEGCSSILFPFIFFVIPSISISEIKETYFHHGQFHYYVITVEAFEPIIRTLKKLEDYSFTKDLDPEDRGRIIDAIANLSRRIKEQNAINLLGTSYGLKALDELQTLPDDIIKDARNIEKNISAEKFDLKRFKEVSSSVEKQKKILIDFTEHKKPAVEIKDIEKVAKSQEKYLE